MIVLDKKLKKPLNEQMKNPDFRNEHKKISIEKLFENFTGNYEPIELDFGKPAGKEIL